ncbi:MAG: hypothetical protein NTX56_02725 [Proteobacteria bacterium]|nr:hypothetical protein [Pseudomonadota bacterium]
MNDLHNCIRTKMSTIPVAIGANATKTGLVIDRQGYGGVEFVVAYGSVTTTGSIVAVVVKEGDVTGTLTSVADADLLGTEALAGLAAGARVAGTGKEVVKRVGYCGLKRYVNLDLISTGTTSAGTIGAVAVLHHAQNEPTANP